MVPCTGLTELFFSFKKTDIIRATRICTACPERAACLAGATKRNESNGIWGGERFVPERTR